jgi:hypothetical protein
MSMSLPINIPWRLIAASPDMMDPQFGNKRFPYHWRSSLAIYAYEPKSDELPEDLCGQQVTFLKISCTITGYSPSPEEPKQGLILFPDVPTEEIDRITKEYFGCYGVLLNVAIFPLGYTNPLPRVRETEKADFSVMSPGTPTFKTPYNYGRIFFSNMRGGNGKIIDRYPPPNGDQKGELELSEEYFIWFPASTRVVLEVVHHGTAIEAVAYRWGPGGGVQLDKQVTPPTADVIHSLDLSGDGINFIDVVSTDPGSSLLTVTCYGWGFDPIDQKNFPHVIDFEPKIRDFYQGVTEQGEILTASNSSVNVGKSFTQTESTETGIDAKATVGKSQEGGGGGSIGMSHKWGSISQDSSNIQTDSSRELRETTSTTTNISQLYNLLTGYHAGTNRAVFLMLPRPHILQPTDRRTFIQGLRTIEGIQDFFLIVSRPEDMKGLCIEALLETGHFPEEVIYDNPNVEYDVYEENMHVYKKGHNCYLGPCDPETFRAEKYPQQGYVVDQRPGKGNPEHRGLTFIPPDNSDTWTKKPENHDINFDIGSDHAIVHGWIKGEGGLGVGGHIDRLYKVHYRSIMPKKTTAPKVLTPFLITSRGLATCFESSNTAGPEPPRPRPRRPGDPGRRPEPLSIRSISQPAGGNLVPIKSENFVIDEQDIEIDTNLVENGQDRLPAIKEILRKIQSAMTSNRNVPSHKAGGYASFVNTHYFKERLKRSLPPDALTMTMSKTGLSDDIIKSIGKNVTIGEVLDMDIVSFATTAKLDPEEAIKIRKELRTSLPTLLEKKSKNNNKNKKKNRKRRRQQQPRKNQRRNKRKT